MRITSRNLFAGIHPIFNSSVAADFVFIKTKAVEVSIGLLQELLFQQAQKCSGIHSSKSCFMRLIVAFASETIITQNGGGVEHKPDCLRLLNELGSAAPACAVDYNDEILDFNRTRSCNVIRGAAATFARRRGHCDRRHRRTAVVS